MFSVANNQSVNLLAPITKEKNGIPLDRYTHFGKLVEYGEFTPIANGNFISVVMSEEYLQHINWEELPFYFGKHSARTLNYYDIVRGISPKPFVVKVGAYNYKLVILNGFIMDYFTHKPLIVLSYLKEYEDTRRYVEQHDTYQYKDENLVLFVNRSLKNTSFFRNFIKLYPTLKEQVTFDKDLSGFLGGIKFSKIQGNLHDFQINILNNFLKENKVDESILSGEQDKLLEVKEL